MYFHVSQVAHAIGTILEPGRFGERFMGIHYGHAPVDPDGFRLLLVEMALETARLAVAPTAPSRMSCIFVAETLEFARSFRDTFRPGAHIFSVEPEGEHQAVRACNYGLITRARIGIPPYYQYMPSESVEYWSETIPTGNHIELLYAGPLRVVDQVE